MVEISKRDWKLYRERVGEWQEHYMEGLTKEYIELLSSPGKASDHFWELEKRIKEDRKHPGVLIQMRKSSAIWDIAMFVGEEVITMADLEGFSEDLIDAVKLILRR
ncbi:multidrug transporter [Blautia schinkii]|nr:multidrug transporter [Blautia schinkii]